MTTVYFSTVVRAGVLALAGEVVALEWESKKILARTGRRPWMRRRRTTTRAAADEVDAESG